MLGLKPIKLLPARERVASALRKAIISKSIPEGAELTLENTAQELGVSVTPVREAFQILARDGLLEVKQNKCAIVLGVTEKTIREHYQLRAALEGTACMLCCQNNADLSKIKNCVDTAEEALSHQQAEIILTTTSPSILRSGKLPAMKKCAIFSRSCGTVCPLVWK